MSTASRWFYRKRAFAMGILGAGASLGAVVMAPVSAWLIDTYQWRTAYVLTGILAWILIIPGALMLKRDPSEIGAGLDGDPRFPVKPDSDFSKTAAFSIGGAIKKSSFWHLAQVWFWFSFCLYMVVTHIVPRAQDSGLKPMQAAALLSILTAVSGISRLAGGMLYLFAIVFGMAFGAGDPPVIAVVTEVFGTAKVGTMMGILMISWGLGSAAGPYLAGLAFDHTGSYRWAFFTAALGLQLATFSSLKLPVKNADSNF
jgi:MFS family permease